MIERRCKHCRELGHRRPQCPKLKLMERVYDDMQAQAAQLVPAAQAECPAAQAECPSIYNDAVADAIAEAAQLRALLDALEAEAAEYKRVAAHVAELLLDNKIKTEQARRRLGNLRIRRPKLEVA